MRLSYRYFTLLLMIFLSCSKVNLERDDKPLTVPTFTNINFVYPQDNSYGEGSKLIFQIEYKNIVEVSGSPTLEIILGNTKKEANYVGGSNSTILEFEYIILNGDNDNDGILVKKYNFSNGFISNEAMIVASEKLKEDNFLLENVLVNTLINSPDKVNNLISAPSTDNTLNLSWQKPNDNGNLIINYSLQYREKDTQLWIDNENEINTNQYNIANLEKNKSYEIRVAANNGSLGEYSDIIEVSIFDLSLLNPIAWLDASDPNNDNTLPNNNTKISEWKDKSGVASSATESDPNKQPTIEYNVKNGLPSIRFDNLDRGLEGSFVRNLNGGLTIFLVGKMDTNTVRKCFFEFYKDGSGNSGTSARRGFFFTHGYNSATTNYNLDDANFNLWRAYDTGSQSSLWENGFNVYNLINNHFPSTSFTGNGTYVLGDDKTGGDSLNGYISEFLIFDRDLTLDEINMIENYLNNKWNLY